MSDKDDFIQIVDDADAAPEDVCRQWKVAIIDDDPAVHEGTRFALSDYNLSGQGIDILSAYSATDGRELLRQHPDLAVILLDAFFAILFQELGY